ncbi:transposase [Streptomyces sp. R41]|uniref:Transposase n=1 Tax=Streptomyces sp. R41 TaxID=3238632 RepID=A0AB39RVN1_9ACTN
MTNALVVGRTLLDNIDFLGDQIDALTLRTTKAVEELPCPDPNGASQPGAGADLVAKLVTIPGVGVRTAQMLPAELGPDMTVFPTADHLVSWAKFAPRTVRSGGKNTSGPTGKGNPWIKGAIGEAALSASRSNTFLGARYKRIVKRRGRKRALVAVGHSLLVVIWHLLNEPGTPYTDLGSDYHQHLVDPTRRTGTWSASSRPSATTSPSHRQPDQQLRPTPGQRWAQPASARGDFPFRP